MSDEEFRKLAVEWGRRSAAEQGFPPLIEDDEALSMIASLLWDGRVEPVPGQTRHAGRTRDGSKRLRPGTAGPMST